MAARRARRRAPRPVRRARRSRAVRTAAARDRRASSDASRTATRTGVMRASSASSRAASSGGSERPPSAAPSTRAIATLRNDDATYGRSFTYASTSPPSSVDVGAPAHEPDRIDVEQQRRGAALVGGFRIEHVRGAEAERERLQPVRVLAQQMAEVAGGHRGRREGEEHADGATLAAPSCDPLFPRGAAVRDGTSASSRSWSACRRARTSIDVDAQERRGRVLRGDDHDARGEALVERRRCRSCRRWCSRPARRWSAAACPSRTASACTAPYVDRVRARSRRR